MHEKTLAGGSAAGGASPVNEASASPGEQVGNGVGVELRLWAEREASRHTSYVLFRRVGQPVVDSGEHLSSGLP